VIVDSRNGCKCTIDCVDMSLVDTSVDVVHRHERHVVKKI